MIIQAPDNTRLVEDYDFHFSPGQFLNVTVDVSLGDAIEMDERVIKIHLSGRDGLTGEGIPEEFLEIERRSLSFHSKRLRKVSDVSPEVKEEWTKTIEELVGKKTIH